MAFACGCSNDREQIYGDGELRIQPRVAEPEYGGNVTRAVEDEFFVVGNEIEVTIKTSKATQAKKYGYTFRPGGFFKGNPGFRFSVDDTYIEELTAVWPAEAVQYEEFISDQRELEDFRLADWLKSDPVKGLMPTDEPLPLTFRHQNALLDFELAGQNVAGVNIESLVLGIMLDENSDDETACWAFCGNSDGHASLVLPGGTRLYTDDENGYKIGVIKISNQPLNQFVVLKSEKKITLKAGERYVVTLVPRGDDIYAYVAIKGWISEVEQGIVVPFQKPVPAEDDTYVINNQAQLLTLSYLTRNYTNPAHDVDWYNMTYIISDSFELSEEYAGKYIPIIESLFGGRIIAGGDEVTKLPYGNNQELELFY